jgi:GrpB-like predicted nucleotidyltransferase (UPF0157 family)
MGLAASVRSHEQSPLLGRRPDEFSLRLGRRTHRNSALDLAWPARFQDEGELLEAAIGKWVVGRIHHVGSIAVPGLSAKPTIDILLGVEDLPSSRTCFPVLAHLGSLYAPYRADEMHWFCKPDPSHRTHQLHLIPADSRRFHELASGIVYGRIPIGPLTTRSSSAGHGGAVRA